MVLVTPTLIIFSPEAAVSVGALSVLEQYSEEELSTADWFNHPDVVSGPFFVTDFDVDHYISYEANKDYWKGAPKIDKLNIKIVDGSQLYAGLQSGEIDITQQTMSDIPQEDYESVEALDNVEVVYGSPVTNLGAVPFWRNC